MGTGPKFFGEFILFCLDVLKSANSLKQRCPDALNVLIVSNYLFTRVTFEIFQDVKFKL